MGSASERRGGSVGAGGRTATEATVATVAAGARGGRGRGRSGRRSGRWGGRAELSVHGRELGLEHRAVARAGLDVEVLAQRLGRAPRVGGVAVGDVGVVEQLGAVREAPGRQELLGRLGEAPLTVQLGAPPEAGLGLVGSRLCQGHAGRRGPEEAEDQGDGGGGSFPRRSDST